MYFDTHAHYDDEKFTEDGERILAALPEAGIKLVLNPGCDLASSRTAAALAERWAHVYAAVGIHPEECGGCTDADLEEIRALCARDKVVAVGEIGLDYYWAENPPREFQQAVFRRQLELALELNLPVIIHDRDAHGDSLAIVEEYPALRGVFHCFSGSPEMAAELLKRGWYLGFDGPITYKNAKKAPEVIELCPMDRLLLETDSPYLSPEPLRGRRNDPRNTRYVAEKLAALRGVSCEELIAFTAKNAADLYRLPRDFAETN